MSWTFYNSNGEALVQNAESEATQAEMEAETAGAKFVPPDLIKHSPGVAKVWVGWEQSGAHGILASYNMDSVTDGSGAGDTDHLWDVDFSSDAASIIVTGCRDNAHVNQSSTTRVATGVTTITSHDDPANGAVDRDNNYLAAFGDQ